MSSWVKPLLSTLVGAIVVAASVDEATEKHLASADAIPPEASTTGTNVIAMKRVAVLAAPATRILSAPQGFDLDHDSQREFIIWVQANGPTHLYECIADDTFTLAHVIQPDSPDYYQPTDTADTDEDGLSDLVMIVSDWTQGVGWEYFLRVYESKSPGSYPTRLAWEVVTSQSTYGGLIGDTDGDDEQEVISLRPWPYRLLIHENEGNDAYVESFSGVIPGQGNYPQSWGTASDLDGDGRSEILMGGWFDINDDAFADVSRLIAFENIGDDEYEIVWYWDYDPEISTQFLIDAGDLDGDGRNELLAGGLKPCCPLESYLHVFEAVADDDLQIVATLVRPNTVEAYSSANLADVDGDGRREIVFGTAWSVTIYENTGDDAWTQIWSADWQSDQVGPVEYLGAGDHDRDGKDEIIFRQEGAFGITGVWEIRPQYAADMDQDGTVDVIDNCPATANPGQSDADADTVGDACDNCLYGPNPTQGAAPLGQPLLAQDQETFFWSDPAEVAYVRGDLAVVSSYGFDLFGTLALATTLVDASLPAAGSGIYYLVRPDCAVGSWQSSLGAEPARDAALP
jgi:hypothetical protein